MPSSEKHKGGAVSGNTNVNLTVVLSEITSKLCFFKEWL